MTVEDVSNQTDHFSHGKGGKDRSDPEAFDVAEEEEGQSGSHGEAGHVEGDLDSGVGHFENLSCFTRKQVGRDEFFSKDHQDSHKCALEDVGLGAECHSWE